MNTYTLVLLAIAAVVVVPAIVFTGLIVPVLLIAGLIVVGGLVLRWLAGEWLDLKKSREMGKESDLDNRTLRDLVGGSEDDEGRFRR